MIGDDLYAISAGKLTVQGIKTLALIDEVSWWVDYSSGPVKLSSSPRLFSGDFNSLVGAVDSFA